MIAITYLVAIFIGFQFGLTRGDQQLYKLCRAQRDRGDYWHDQYKHLLEEISN